MWQTLTNEKSEREVPPEPDTLRSACSLSETAQLAWVPEWKWHRVWTQSIHKGHVEWIRNEQLLLEAAKILGSFVLQHGHLTDTESLNRYSRVPSFIIRNKYCRNWRKHYLVRTFQYKVFIWSQIFFPYALSTTTPSLLQCSFERSWPVVHRAHPISCYLGALADTSS